MVRKKCSWSTQTRPAQIARSGAILRAITPLLTTAAIASEILSPRPSDTTIRVQRAVMRGCAAPRIPTTAQLVCWRYACRLVRISAKWSYISQWASPGIW